MHPCFGSEASEYFLLPTVRMRLCQFTLHQGSLAASGKTYSKRLYCCSYEQKALKHQEAVLPLQIMGSPHKHDMLSTTCARTKIKLLCCAELPHGGMFANTLTAQLERCVPNSNQSSCKEELVPEHEERIVTLTLKLPYTSSMRWGKIRCQRRRLQERWPGSRRCTKTHEFIDPSANESKRERPSRPNSLLELLSTAGPSGLLSSRCTSKNSVVTALT